MLSETLRPESETTVETSLPQAPVPTAWDSVIEPVQPFLQLVQEGLAAQVNGFDKEIAPYARYALASQGKHLRPTLVFLSGQSVGECSQALVRAAIIIEMVHLATLVHDDIMDAASLRRMRPTASAHWGNEVSVLLGDCLFAHALKLASEFPTTEVCRAVAAATRTVCSGEILQTLRSKQSPPALGNYFKVIGMKTAELFALSSSLGASLAGGTQAQVQALRKYGYQLGIAYQIHDDCLDLFGSETRTGKSLGTDLASGKITLPVLLALERSTAEERTRIESWLGQWSPQLHLKPLREWLEKNQALRETQSFLHQSLHEARTALAIVPDSPSREALLTLTQFLLLQNNELESA
ncbi:MAG: polyprenyl synthetase family protein [Verrucomicrobia bacterium]|nr:polyprenyl synthetase family protein [Verrucomicrobiota bacterium]